MTPTTPLDLLVRGARASTTLDQLDLSNAWGFGAGGGSNNNSQTPRGGSIPLVGNKHATYSMLYRTQPWVMIAVNRISRGIARLGLDAIDGASDPNERIKLRSGALYELLSDPYEGGNPSLWKQGIVYNLLVHSNAIVVKVRPGPGRPPSELIPSDFAFWSVVPGENRPIDYWVYNGARGVKIPFTPEEVIHFHPWAEGTGLVATSPLESLRTTLMLEDATQRALIAAYENGMRPVGAYSVEGTFKDKAAAERMRAQLNERYGGVDQAYKIMLLEGGAKWQPMVQNFHDQEVVALRKLTKGEIVSVYNLPPTAVGILDDATYSNITEQHLMEYQDTYSPWTTLIQDTLAIELIKDEPTMEGQFAEFNYHEVLRGDPIKEMDTLGKAVGGPIMTPNEARKVINLPPKDGGDELNEVQGAAPAAAAAPAASGG